MGRPLAGSPESLTGAGFVGGGVHQVIDLGVGSYGSFAKDSSSSHGGNNPA